MEKTNFKFIILLIILALVILGVLLLFLRGDEDTWICERGAWIKHGNPRSPAPSRSCSIETKKGFFANIIDKSIKGNKNASNESDSNFSNTGSDININDSNNNGNGGDINNNVGLANPASVNCQNKGGKLQIQNTNLGQTGICVFSDGSRCEEWAFFREECQVGNSINVFTPRNNQEVSPPIFISGEARGNWFFEASFPVKIVDAQNNIISQSQAQALSDWMTEGFVPFQAELTGIFSQRTEGFLILEKDNPSGLAENGGEVRIPIIILPNTP